MDRGDLGFADVPGAQGADSLGHGDLAGLDVAPRLMHIFSGTTPVGNFA